MVFATLILLLLIFGLLLYKRKFKAIIILSILFLGLFIYLLHGISVEDFYGRNNNIYFDGSKGDTVIMTDPNTNQFISKGQISHKSWNRVYIKSENDTLDLNDWITQKAGYMSNVKCKLIKTDENN